MQSVPELDTPTLNLPASAVAAYLFRGVTPCSHLRSSISPAAYVPSGYSLTWATPLFAPKNSREPAMYDVMFMGLSLVIFVATALAIVAMGKI